MIKFKKAQLAHVLAIEPLLREPDKRELIRMGVTVKRALEKAYNASESVWIVLIDGEIACVFGIALDSILGNVGNPWFLSTRMMDNYKAQKALLRHSPRYLKRFLKKYRVLSNYVDAEYTQALRWLSWLGFKIEPPEISPITGAKFCRIILERC